MRWRAQHASKVAVAAFSLWNVAALACAPLDAAEAQRIVSLNLCTDQLVVDLVEPRRIAGVTELATDPLSTPVPERARELPVTLATAEDVIGRRADLVLASPFTPAATLDLMRRAGVEVVTIGAAQTLDGVKQAIRKAASATGRAARGDALVADIDAAIERNKPSDAARPSIIVYQVNNFVTDSGGLVSELLALAGFRNHAPALRGLAGGRVDIEMLVTDPPDVLVLTSAPSDYATVVADNLRHPALRALAGRVPMAVLPWSGWLCGTHHIAGVLDQLGALRRRVVAGGGRG